MWSKIIDTAIQSREKLLKDMLNHYGVGVEKVKERAVVKEFGNGGFEYYVDGELAVTIQSIEYHQEGDTHIARQRVIRHYKEG